MKTIKVEVKIEIFDHPEKCEDENNQCPRIAYDFIDDDNYIGYCRSFFNEKGAPVVLNINNAQFIKCDECKAAWKKAFKIMAEKEYQTIKKYEACGLELPKRKTKIGQLAVDKNQLINPDECAPWLRQIVGGFKKQTDSVVRCYKIPEEVKKRPMSISGWANTHRKIPPYLKNAIDQIQDDKVERVIVKKGRHPESDFEKAFRYGVQGGNPFPWFLIKPDGTQEEIDENRISNPTEFKQQYLANPWKPTEEKHFYMDETRHDVKSDCFESTGKPCNNCGGFMHFQPVHGGQYWQCEDCKSII